MNDHRTVAERRAAAVLGPDPTSGAGPGNDRPVVPAGRARLWPASSIVVTFLAASSAPTPLYEVYERSWDTGALTGTIAFAVYAVSVLVGLLCLGSLSEHVGRRQVVIAAIALQLVALVLFATAGSFAPIMIGRVLQGLGAGAALGTLGAIMVDTDQRLGATANAAAPGAGTASGALLSGLVVQYLPWPTHLVYLVVAGLLVVQAAAAAVVLTERRGAPRPSPTWASLRPSIGVPRHGRRAFWTVAPVVFAVWGLAGFYAALGPALYHRLANSTSVAAGASGLVVLTGVASLSTVVLRTAQPRTVTLIGATALVTGLGLTVLGVATGSTATYLLATAVAGVGFGSGFQGGIRTALAAARPHERTGILSAVFLVAYLGMALPAVASGAAIAHGSPVDAVALVVAVVLAVLAVLAAAALVPTLLAPTARTTP